MKYNEIMPECFIDTTLVGSLLDAKVNHKHSCNEVAREMEKGKYKKVLIVPTGAIFSPTRTFQKDSIPSIAHAISLEVSE